MFFEPLVQRNKQYQRKVLISCFHFNDYTYGFNPQTEKYI